MVMNPFQVYTIDGHSYQIVGLSNLVTNIKKGY